MNKEVKIRIISAALICSLFTGEFILKKHFDNQNIVSSNEETTKEVIDYENGEYVEKIEPITYINSNGEIEYYAPEGYVLVCDSNGEYTCIRHYKAR